MPVWDKLEIQTYGPNTCVSVKEGQGSPTHTLTSSYTELASVRHATTDPHV